MGVGGVVGRTVDRLGLSDGVGCGVRRGGREEGRVELARDWAALSCRGREAGLERVVGRSNSWTRRVVVLSDEEGRRIRPEVSLFGCKKLALGGWSVTREEDQIGPESRYARPGVVGAG